MTEACDFALSSSVPPTATLIAGRQRLFERLDLRRQRRVDRLGEYARGDVRMHGQRRHTIAPPDERIGLPVLEGRELAQRHGASAGDRDLKVGERVERHALLVVRPDDHIDEIDVVAHLGNC